MKYSIHTEKIWDNNVWRNLLDFIEKHKENCHLFLMNPDYDYQKAVMGFRGTAVELKKTLSERYEKLRELSLIFHFRIGLHFHLTLFPESLPEKEKLRQFEKAYYFLMAIFGEVDGVVFGWYKSDRYLDKLAQEHKLDIYYVGIHDYDMPLTNSKLLEFKARDILRKLLR